MFCAEISSGFPDAFQRQAGRPSLGLVAGSCVSGSAAEVLETSLRNKTQPDTGCRAAQRIPLCSLDIFHPTPHKLLGFCVKRVILQIKSVLVSSLLAWQPRRIDGTALLQLSWLLSHLHAARLGWGSAQLRHVALPLVPAETPNWSPGCWGSGAKPSPGRGRCKATQKTHTWASTGLGASVNQQKKLPISSHLPARRPPSFGRTLDFPAASINEFKHFPAQQLEPLLVLHLCLINEIASNLNIS